MRDSAHCHAAPVNATMHEVKTMNAIAIYGHRIPLAIPSFSSRDMNDFGVVCLWTLIGLMLSISAGIFDYGADIATVLAMAE
jgi:hypothetical protein